MSASTAKPLLIVLAGPTASGKTDVSLALAERLPVVILSADSRQLYRGLTVGTAKPTPDHLARFEHHFIDCLDPDTLYSAGEYELEALEVISSVLASRKIPLLVGGSGLYIQAVVYGLSRAAGSSADIREGLETQMKELGEQGMLELLGQLDPDTARTIEKGKPRRIIRALEIFYTTGKRASEHHTEPPPERPFCSQFFGLRVPRSELYRRIDRRVLRMIEGGLLDEVRALQSKGYDDSLNALNTVGYREAFMHLKGELGRDEMIARIQRNTRRYAKRQMTWFRANESIRWIDASDTRTPEEIANEIMAFVTP